MTSGPLAGIRILEFSQIVAGPFAGVALSDFGADVVKVEPLEGESRRNSAAVVPNEGKYFQSLNRGKRSLTVDLSRPEGRALIHRLVPSFDVVLINYRAGVPAKMGIDYPSLKALNPRLIYASVTGFGETGPYATRAGSDIVAQAYSGLMAAEGKTDDHGAPAPIMSTTMIDRSSGLAAAMGICAALFHREKTGEGQAINSSLLLSALTLQAGSREIVAIDEEVRQTRLAHLAEARARGATIEEIYAERRKLMPELAGNIYYRPYKTKDSYLVVGCLGPGPRARFRQALEIHDPRYEPGFDTSRLREVGAELVAICEAKFQERTNDEWVAFLDVRDIACGPIRFVDELWDDPQVHANNFLIEYDHTLLGPLRGPAPIVQMSSTPTRVQRAAPALGEHSDEVLCELGFSAAEVEAFRLKGLVG